MYVTADFSGGISTVTGLGNSLGLQQTAACNGCAAGSVSGHVAFDQNLIPGSGTGTVNVPLTSFLGAADNIVFSITFGSEPLEFGFGDMNVLGGPSIQFTNGVFDGFFFTEDFVLDGKTYELSMQGESWAMSRLKTNSTSDLVAEGFVTVGTSELKNQEPFGSTQPQVTIIPEPTSLALMAFGLLGIIMTRCRVYPFAVRRIPG